MKQSLKLNVQQHLNNKSLSTQQLNQLMALQQNHHKTNKPAFPWLKLATVVSTLIVSIMLTAYLTYTTQFSEKSIALQIAEEVAKNHLKLKPLEVTANTLQDIVPYFKQLGFSAVSPTLFKLSKQNLLGARYCSIQGITALQLRLMNPKTDKVQTLYETEYDKTVFKSFAERSGGKPMTVFVKGVKVDMWVEKGLLFALIE